MSFLLRCCCAIGALLSAGVVGAANQSATTTPVIVGGQLPYQVALEQYDVPRALDRPALHSFSAGYIVNSVNGRNVHQWVILGGLEDGLHGFVDNRTSITDRNADVWVIDPVNLTSWRRNLVTEQGGLTDAQILSITSANTQFEQVGDRLYIVGGYGDNSLTDPTSRDTFDSLTAIDLPDLVDWVKGGTNGIKDADDGTAGDHLRQIRDPLFKVTGGDLHEIDGQFHLVFGHDFNRAYAGNSFNGTYTHQVRTFTVHDDGASLGFTDIGRSGNEQDNPEFRRRDLNVFPTVRNDHASLEQGITVLSGVFTATRGAWTVPVEIDAAGNAMQIDLGNDPLNAGNELDNDGRVFKQGMNNYHSAKLGMFSSATGAMHELLFGGITLQEFDPQHPNADAQGFVTDNNLPNTSQISSVIRRDDGSYEQHYLGAFPQLFTDEPTPNLMRFGSNAEFFVADGIPTFANGVIDFDALPVGNTTLGYVFGGIAAFRPHVFTDPRNLSAASSEIFTVIITKVPEPTGAGLSAVAAVLLLARGRCHRGLTSGEICTSASAAAKICAVLMD